MYCPITALSPARLAVIRIGIGFRSGEVTAAITHAPINERILFSGHGSDFKREEHN